MQTLNPSVILITGYLGSTPVDGADEQPKSEAQEAREKEQGKRAEKIIDILLKTDGDLPQTSITMKDEKKTLIVPSQAAAKPESKQQDKAPRKRRRKQRTMVSSDEESSSSDDD